MIYLYARDSSYRRTASVVFPAPRKGPQHNDAFAENILDLLKGYACMDLVVLKLTNMMWTIV